MQVEKWKEVFSITKAGTRRQIQTSNLFLSVGFSYSLQNPFRVSVVLLAVLLASAMMLALAVEL